MTPTLNTKMLPVSNDVWLQVKSHADSARLSVSDYLSALMLQEDKDPWIPVPKRVSERWNQEEEEFWAKYESGNVEMHSAENLDEHSAQMSNEE